MIPDSLLTLFDGLSAAQLLLCALAVLFASFMRAFTGFGFALLAVPVFSLFLVPGDSVVLAAVLTLAVSAMTYKAWWGKFPVRELLPMALGSVLGSAVGVRFLAGASLVEFQLWIGITVIVACLALARLQPRDERGGRWLAGGTGVFSGLMNGAFAIPGPPVVAYVMMCIADAERSRAFLMAFFFFSNLIALLMFHSAGVVTPLPFQLLVVAMPVMLLGDRLGAWLFQRVGGAAYRPVAFGISLSVGIAITAKALFG